MRMTKGAATLARPVRPGVILACFGQFAPSLAVVPGVPVPVALAVGDWETAIRCGAATAVLLLLWPLCRWLCGPPGRDVQHNEALVVSALCFVAASAALAWPLKPPDVPWDAAIFEAVSAITSTGLTVFGDVETRPLSILFLRAWGQWYGGLAILVLALSITVRPGVLAKRLGSTETTQHGFIGGTKARALRVLVVYGVLTVAAVLTLWALTGSWRDGLLHGLTSVSTAGFSSYADSLADWTPAAQAAAMAFSMAGAVSLLFWYSLRTEGPRHLLDAREAQALVVLMALGTVLIVWAEAGWHDTPLAYLDWGVVGDAAFVSASAQTTTGYSTLEVGMLAPASQLILIVQMIVGADLGSTGGGLKVARMLVLIAIVRRALLATALPQHAVAPIRATGGRVDEPVAETGMLLALLYGATVVLAWSLLLAMNVPPLAGLFEVVSATSTVGLSAGVTGMETPTGVKAVLMICMLLGRLEFLALLVLLTPQTWKEP